MMKGPVEPLRDIIGRAIYEEHEGEDWYSLSEERREPWRKDGDRVITALKGFGTPWFEEFALHLGGVDWLAIGPDELWTEFFQRIEDTKGPVPGNWLDLTRFPDAFR